MQSEQSGSDFSLAGEATSSGAETSESKDLDDYELQEKLVLQSDASLKTHADEPGEPNL